MKTKQLGKVNKPSTIILTTCLGEGRLFHISLCQGVIGMAFTIGPLLPEKY